MDFYGAYILQTASLNCLACIGSSTTLWFSAVAQRAFSNLCSILLAASGREEQPRGGAVLVLLVGFLSLVPSADVEHQRSH